MIPEQIAFMSAAVARILVVDDDEHIRSGLCDLLRPMGYSLAEVGSAEAALETIRADAPDLVLLDLHLPGRSGNEILVDIRSDPRTRLLPVIMLTGAGTRKDKLRAIEAGVTDFMQKPFSSVELTARVRSLLQLKFFTDDLEEAGRMMIALAKAIDARDPYTARHSERVSHIAGLLGERVGVKEPELTGLRRGTLLHDLGKIAVRDRILLHPGKLSSEEFQEIKQHPIVGSDLVQNMKTMCYALPVIRHHHERLDGSGYPGGLSGDQIPLVSQVATIADIFDALTSARVYRAALTQEEAFQILNEEAGKGWRDFRLISELGAVMEGISEGGMMSG